MKKSKPGFNVDAIAAHVIAYEIAMACLLEVLAKQQPALAESVAIAMRQSLAKIPNGQVPGLEEKLELYLTMIDTQLSKNLQ